MALSTCCGWESYTTYDLCPECKEHCDWEEIDQEDIIEDQKTEDQINELQINKNN
jgi:hypothetical protein